MNNAFIKLRVERGFKRQEDLAKAIDVNIHTIGRIERGVTKDLRTYTLVSLANALDVTEQDILDTL